MKVDVFVLGADAHSREELARRQHVRVGQDRGVTLPLASAEDVILRKLAWFEAGGRETGQQWSDVQSVLRVRRALLDVDYLRRNAATLGVEELLRAALVEAGLEVGDLFR